MDEEDLINRIIDFEEGLLSANETIDMFQRLVDTGLAWRLQGSYGRMAQALIDTGRIERRRKQ